MTDDPNLALGRALSSIERIAILLPGVGERSGLRVASHEVIDKIEEARRHEDALEKEIISLKYEYRAQRFERKKGVKRGEVKIKQVP